MDDHQPQDLDQHCDNKINHDQNILNTKPDNDHDLDIVDHVDINDDLDEDVNDQIYVEKILNYEGGPFYCTDNNPPDSYAICEAKVADWLDRNTFMERKASVKFACVKNLDPACATRRPSRSRAVSLNQRPKLSIIGFRKKPVAADHGKSNKQHNNNDRVENAQLFRNRSEPGRDYCLLITDPVSPKVSCVGRVGSVRVQGSRNKQAGVWRSFKSAFTNLLVQTNRPVQAN